MIGPASRSEEQDEVQGSHQSHTNRDPSHNAKHSLHREASRVLFCFKNIKGKKAQVSSRETMRSPARVEGDKTEQSQRLWVVQSLSFSLLVLFQTSPLQKSRALLNTAGTPTQWGNLAHDGPSGE